MNTQVEQVLQVFEGFRMAPTNQDEYHTKGRAVLAEKMNRYVETNKPIEFVMLGYPFKSINNRDKVIGTKPDLGEELTFSNFSQFNNQVKTAHFPGVNITLVTDGYVFNDLMDVPDNTVAEYKEINMDMSRGNALTWYDLGDFYTRNTSLPAARHKIIEQFGITEPQLEHDILFNADVRLLYQGMIKFMEGDLAINNYNSNNQLHKAAKKLAHQMMLRNEAYSNLVRKEFPDHIRLSMHPSINDGAKFSFQMLPTPRAWTSPWHCAIVVDAAGDYATIHRKSAELAGYKLVERGGRPYNFHSDQKF